jgi:streptogramin lyase
LALPSSDPTGTIWFNVNPAKGGLGKLDTKTDKIEVFIPPEGMGRPGVQSRSTTTVAV